MAWSKAVGECWVETWQMCLGLHQMMKEREEAIHQVQMQ